MQVSPFEMKEKAYFAMTNYGSRMDLDEGRMEYCFKTGNYGVVERLIIEALYKYKYLNSYNLERLLNLYLKPGMKKKSYTSNIKRLVKDGTICTMDYMSPEPALRIYLLSEESYAYIRSEQKAKVTYEYKHMPSKISAPEEIEEIMGRMSLNQWHISILCGKQYRAETYFARKRVGQTRQFMKSCFVIRLEGKKEIAAVSIPAAKTELSEMLEEIKLIDGIFSKARKKNMYLFICCESQEHIINTQKLLEKRFKFIKPVYTIDAYTAKCTGLKWLYACHRNGGVYELVNFDIT